jgi:hypothetical protein
MSETMRSGENEAAAAVRRTRAYQAGVAFGVPADAIPSHVALLVAAAYPLVAASVLRDAAEELEHAGLCQAGRVVLRLAAKHEAAE